MSQQTETNGRSKNSAALPEALTAANARKLGNEMRTHEGSLELFHQCIQLHKASLVGLVSVGILMVPVAKRIGEAINKAIEQHDYPDAAQAIDYLDFETRVSQHIGPEASLLHLGRSRQDLLSTYSRLFLRSRVIEVMQQLTSSRGKLLDLASKHVETVVPTFTHGVPAQPTTFGHYLLSYGGALERSQERLSQSYNRLNVSPYGVAVGTTSSFLLDRHVLASMLAFDDIIENSYDANHVAPIDLAQDVVAPLTTLALAIGMVTQDLTTYQSTAYPWLTTAAPGFTGISSCMPQKRNPRILEYIREAASEIVAASHGATIMAHNGTSGLVDVRETFQRLPLTPTVEMLKLFDALMDSVRIDSERALYQVSHDYSTITELADELFITCQVPFRTGHEFASKLVDYGRNQRIGTTEIGYLEASAIYNEIAGQEFPMTEDQFLVSLDPTCLVKRRRGVGGPQKAEVLRTLQESRKRLAKDSLSVQQLVERLDEADSALNREFTSIVCCGPVF